MMKENNNSRHSQAWTWTRGKKSVLILFAIAFTFVIGLKLYMHFNFYTPIYRTSIDLHNDRSTVKETFNLKKDGCYRVGLYSNGDLFDGRDRVGHGVIKFGGDYSLAYYHQDKLLDSKKFPPKAFAGISLNGPSKASKLELDTIEVPFNAYKTLTIELNVTKIPTQLKDNSQSTYLYVEPYQGPCGVSLSKIMKKREFHIDKTETNETLQPLYNALKARDSKTAIKLFEENNISVNTEMLGGRHPVHYAAFFDDDEILKYLIARGVNLNIQDELLKTPLHYGIENNATKTVEVLLENGADLSLVKDVDNHLKRYHFDSQRKIRVISYVVNSNLLELAKILLQHGLDPNDSGEWKRTALDFAMDQQSGNYWDMAEGSFSLHKYNYDEMILLLRRYNAVTCWELNGWDPSTWKPAGPDLLSGKKGDCKNNELYWKQNKKKYEEMLKQTQ